MGQIKNIKLHIVTDIKKMTEKTEKMDTSEYEKISLKPIKGSRKSKKAWRKHGDIGDIEQHLESVWQDQRSGANKLTEKPDDVLFQMDTTPKVEVEGKKKKNKVGSGVIEVDEDDDEVYVPRRKKMQSNLTKEDAVFQAKKEALRKSKVCNIWGQEAVAVTDSYIEHTVKKPKVRPSTVNVGKADVSAVPLPASGASYNPDYDSHQQLLLKAHLEEDAKLKEREKWASKVKMVSVKELKKRSKNYLKEMSEGLSLERGDSDEEEEDGEQSKPEFAPPPVSADNKKTLQKRRRESLIRKAKHMKLEQKLRKLRLNDVMRLKTLKKEIRKEDEKSAETQAKRAAIKALEANKPKRIGKHKYVEQDTDVLLSDELVATLRELKPDGNLLQDRFKSLQRRNIIEPRNRVLPHTRYRRKVVVKRSYKNSLVQGSKPHR